MQRRRRWLVLFLAIGGALLLMASYQLPYWHFKLVAPQYPKGLSLEIGLSGITGDVAEIDILNHYIGMMKMSTAASLERAMSVYIVSIAALGTLAGVIATGKRLGWLGVAVALGLPLGFLVDTTYWMYRFGHELEPQAPLKFSPFMPVLVGKGTIGQFHTTAWPAAGFWMAIAASLMVAVAVYLRKQVCDHCPKTATCGKTCNHLIVFTSSLETPS
ncbi:MAG: cytochrome C [Acidimicrobiales bacterium]|nr:cytochrome C [Acidimicrobiales bacterium]